MGIFNRKKDMSSAILDFEKEYKRVEEEFNRKIQETNQTVDRLNAKLDKRIGDLDKKIDMSLGAVNQAFGNHTMDSQRTNGNIPRDVYDYWTKGQEAKNEAKNMTPEEREAVEKKLEEIMESDNPNQSKRR